MSEPGKPMDEALAALYRGLPRDEPPPAVDAAILAAAQASVIAKPRRQWAVPVSLAAVLVLSVSVTLRVFEERPDTQSMQAPAAPPVAARPSATSPSEPAPSVPSPPAPPSASASASASPPSATAQANPSPRSANAQPERLARQEAAAPEEHRAGSATAPSFVPSPQADSAQVPAAAAPPPRVGPPPAAFAERSMARADRAPLAAKSAADSNLASAEAERPEAWLDRIVTLRAQARHAEADENFAQFKRRYPSYIIAPEVLEKIAPRP